MPSLLLTVFHLCYQTAALYATKHNPCRGQFSISIFQLYSCALPSVREQEGSMDELQKSVQGSDGVTVRVITDILKPSVPTEAAKHAMQLLALHEDLCRMD